MPRTQLSASNARPGNMPRRLLVVGLLIAMAVAAGVRLYRLGSEDYWLDELHSLADSAASRGEFEAIPHGVILQSAPRFTELTPESTWPAVWRAMEVDTHPPTYFLFLLSWRRLFGDGEFAVRTLSILLSVLSILPVALILREYGRSRAALGVAVLLAVAFAHIHIAQEARPYSLGLLFVSISYYAFVKMEVGWNGFDRRKRILWGVTYGLAVYLAVLTHYFTVLALAGQAVVVAVRVRGTLRRTWLTIVMLAVVGFAVTWGRQWYGQLGNILSQDWLLEQRPDHALRTALRLADLPVRLLLAHERFQPNYAFSFVGAAVLVGGLTTLWHQRRREALVFAAWYLLPLLTFAVTDLVAQKQLLTHLRYTSIVTPALIGMIVLSAEGFRRPLRWAAVAGLSLAVLLTLKLPTQENPKNRMAARLIAGKADRGDLLVFDAIGWPPFWTARICHNVSYYLPDYLQIPMPPRVLLRERPDAALKRQMARYERIIVVTPRIEEIPNPLPGQYELVDQAGYVDMVGFIYLFARTPDGV